MIQTPFRGIGLMCGTSHDGIDICDVSFELSNSTWSFDVHASDSIPLSGPLKEKLSLATEMTAIEYVILDKEFATFSAEAVVNFIKKSTSKASFIASHGVTIFHQPERGISTQLGSGAIIAALTGLQTISDFRIQDVTKGGQGAPLVPYADSMLFSNYDATLNLGGFANISRLKNLVTGFDIGVCNLLLNHLSMRLNCTFDEGGELAKSGQVNKQLLNQLNDLPFFKQSGPKSLGKEWFDQVLLPVIENFNSIRTQDLLATGSEHIAFQIGKILNIEKEICLVSGGGVHNAHLIERIKHFSKSDIIIPRASIINFKEAICFAFLGNLRLLQSDNISRSTTGANQNSCAGAVYLP